MHPVERGLHSDLRPTALDAYFDDSGADKAAPMLGIEVKVLRAKLRGARPLPCSSPWEDAPAPVRAGDLLAC